MSNARPSDIYNLCQFTFANGRMCGLPAHPKGDGLCLTHFRYTQAQAKAKAAPRKDNLSAEVASLAGDYITKIDINHVLGKLFDALAANRLSARRWNIELPVFKNLLRLKYPKNHPNHPAPDEKPASAKSRAIPRPADPSPQVAHDPAPESAHAAAPRPSLDPSTERLPIV